MPGRTRDAGLGSIKARIAGRLRQAINDGEYRAGDPLPSTNELAEAEEAAAMTVRASFDQLISEGLVVAVPRKGYFVREQLALTWHMNAWQDPDRLDTLPEDAWTADIEAAGFKGRQDIHIGIDAAARIVADRPLSEWLSLPSNAKVVARQRMRYIGRGTADEPESIADSYYPHDLVRDTEIMAPESVNTAAILRDLGERFHRYVDVLVPRIATPEEADRLQLPPATAVLELVRTAITAADRPVVAQHMIRPGRGSHFIYHVTYPDRPT